MRFRKNLIALFIVVILVVFPANLLIAIDFPAKPINVVVGFGPGGTTDLAARPMLEKMAKELGVPMIVLNKPGSGGLVGAEFVAGSKPDGYTIHVMGIPLMSRQSYDLTMPIHLLKDFEPICMFCAQTMFIAVKADSKFKTIDDLIDFALKNPGKLSHGTPGIGTGGYFVGEILRANFKITFKHVPFKSDGEAVTALMGGHTDFMGSGWGQLSNKVVSGDLRVLLCFDEKRNPEAKDVPTIGEKGFPEATTFSFFAFIAPAGTPKEIIEKLDKAARAAIEDPATVATLKKMGFYKIYKGPEDLGNFFKAELEKYTKISKAAGIIIK